MSEAAPWWTTAVVYQVYPRSFADADGDGVGDLRGVLAHLDHLVDLGVDVVWLSPVYPSPHHDNGYDISDYQDVDPVFGSLADLDELIAALHERGMKLVMDLVVNHTSDEHPWFTASRSSRTDPKRDWYWWRPARPGTVPGSPGAEPNDWGSFFSGPAWTYDEASGEYYLHLFSHKQPDLHWEDPEVRQAVYAMMRWWLDRGVDGFRMDVINMIAKPPGLPDAPVPPGAQYGEPLALLLQQEHLHDHLQEMHREVFAGREGLLTVGEMPGVSVEQAVLFTDPARGELDMVFQFEHVGIDHVGSKWETCPFDLLRLKRSLGRWQEGLGQRGWNSLYWSNHDQPRVVSRFGDDGEHRVRSATMLATVLHLHRGTPYVYQGEELGLPNVPFDRIEDFRDVESLNHYRWAVARGEDPEQVLASLRRMSRDNARTPMPWVAAAPHAGFTTGEPWMPLSPDHVALAADQQRADPTSVFAHYRRLVALRHDEPVVARGDFTMLLPESAQVYAFTRRLDDVELLVLGNFTPEQVPVDLSGWTGAELLLSNVQAPADGLVLAPWEARVHRRVRG